MPRTARYPVPHGTGWCRALRPVETFRWNVSPRRRPALRRPQSLARPSGRSLRTQKPRAVRTYSFRGMVTLIILLTLALCLLPFDSALGLGAGPQVTWAGEVSRSDAALVPGVVQLLAVGPGERGKNRACAATGFLINEQGYLVTNAHVVEDLERCLAKMPGTKILAKFPAPGSSTAQAVPCDLVGRDEVHDLAVLKTERPIFTGPYGKQVYAHLDPRELAEGTSVVVSGHPVFAWQPVVQAGKVIRRGSQRLAERNPEPTEVLDLDIPLWAGSSGSPVCRAEGQGVIGIVVGKHPSQPTHTLAVSVRYAIALLNCHGVKWHTAADCRLVIADCPIENRQSKIEN